MLRALASTTTAKRFCEVRGGLGTAEGGRRPRGTVGGSSGRRKVLVKCAGTPRRRSQRGPGKRGRPAGRLSPESESERACRECAPLCSIWGRGGGRAGRVLAFTVARAKPAALFRRVETKPAAIGDTVPAPREEKPPHSAAIRGHARGKGVSRGTSPVSVPRGCSFRCPRWADRENRSKFND